MGRFNEGIAEARKAQALDPTSASIRANRSSVLYLAGRYQESIKVSRESLALDPESSRALLVLGMSLEQLGHRDEAIQALKKACGSSPAGQWCWGSLGHAYGVAGRVKEASSVLESLRDPRTQHRLFDEALVALGLGKVSETLGLLRSACDDREFHVVILKVDPRFARLRSNPEFQAILAQIWRQTGRSVGKRRTLPPVEAAGAERSQLNEGK
jgi:tetratricopeptide (TPR) repeat protein